MNVFSQSLFGNFNVKNVQNVTKIFFNQSCFFQSKNYELPSTKFKNAPVYSFVSNKNSTNGKKTKTRLLVWGYAGTGALGEPEFLRPVKDRSRIYHKYKPWRLRWCDRVDAQVTHVACGNGFSLIATSNTIGLKGHHLFGTGMNIQSQIGVHETKGGEKYKYIIEPSLIELPFEKSQMEKLKILDISCGRAHSIVLTNLGIISFGNNSYGQCGRPIIENEEYFGNRAVVQNISKYIDFDSSDDKIISVKCGQDHTCLLTQNGNVLTFGWSADGQLGQNIYTVNSKPKIIKGDLDGNKIVQIATKGDFCLALSDKGEIFGWGNNEYKQLSMSGSNEPQIGVPMHLKIPNDVKRPISKIAASGTHCLIIDGDDNIWVWGFGLLGKGPNHQELATPAQIPNTLFGLYPEIEHSLKKRPTAVNCGLNCSSVSFDDGSLYMWGRNKYGNLGIDEDVDGYMPIRVNLTGNIKALDCGPDQTFAICNTSS